MRVTWDDVRPYSQGVKQGVLYPENSPGVAWNGLTSVTEKGDDSPSSLYIDGQKVRNKATPSAFAGTIKAFTYPDDFEPMIGLVSGISSQPRPSFGFCYRNNNEIHLVYNALVSPSSDQYSSLSGQPSPVEFSWDFTTQPAEIPGGRNSSHLVVLIDYSQSGAISSLEALLYGDDDNDPSLPDPAAVIDIFESNAVLRITDNGDGTWTAVGPDDVVTMVDGGGWSFQSAGTAATPNYFIVTVTQSASIHVGNFMRLFHAGVHKEDTLFTIASLSAPFAGFVNVFFTPNAQTGVTGTDTATEADKEFDIDWPSAVFIDADSYTIESL
jgi:hypothetical protein